MKILVIGIILSVLSGIISLIDKWKKKGKVGYKKTNVVAMLTFLLALIGGWLTLDSGKNAIAKEKISDSLASQKQRDNERLTKSLIEKQSNIEKLQQNQLVSLTELVHSSNLLSSAQTKITVLQSELLAQATGNGNKPVIKGHAWRKENGLEVVIMLYNYSKYPLSSISCEVVDYYQQMESVLKINEDGNISFIPKKTDFSIHQTAKLDFLGPFKKERAYTSIAPKGIPKLKYVVTISWPQGKYQATVTFDSRIDGNPIRGKVDKIITINRDF